MQKKGHPMASPSPDRLRLHDHAVHGIPPVGDPYRFGLWHKDRAALSGYAFEARVHLKALLGRNHPDKFLMLGRPRSGTTLLYRLLRQVPGLHCDGEVLHHAVLAPRLFLNRLASIKQARAWGAKLITYQMFEVQRIPDHAAFLEGLVADGFHLIHIRRGTYAQCLSLSTAQAVQQYHIRADAGGADTPARQITLDPTLFLRQITWNRAMLDYETALLAPLPHLVVDYEADLARPDCHQPTVDRICATLGLPPGPVRADLERVAGRTVITNLAEIHATLRAAGHGDILPAGT
jgi:hypothetical protein